MGGPWYSLDRVILTGDVLRANPDFTYHQDSNLTWLKAALGPGLGRHAIELDVWDSASAFPFAELYRILYGQPGAHVTEAWAAAYDALDPAAEALIAEAAQGALVVVFEPSRSMMEALTHAGIAAIEVRVHPWRCGADLMLALASNDDDIQARLKAIPRRLDIEALDRAALRRELSGLTSYTPKGALVFLAQVDGDASLIQDGRLCGDVTPYADQLRALAGSRLLAHLPHPYGAGSRSLASWLDLFPQSIRLGGGAYRDLCQDRSQRYVTLSSGAGYEAEAFGYPVDFLLRHHWGHSGSYRTHYTAVREAWQCPDFWGYLLHGGEVPTDVGPEPFQPDRLRSLIRVEWAPRHRPVRA